MLVRTFALLVVLGVAGAAVWTFSPGLRTQMTALWDSHTGWTEAARQADPAGFAAHAEAKLQQDLAKMDATRRQFTAEVGRLSKTAREQSALAEQARRLAEQFRDVYQTAQADGRFPVEVRGAAYTQSQVRSQVSMLLAEAEGYEAALDDLESVRATAEAKIEELAVRINRIEAQLASLATKRELLRARQLTAAGEELLAQVDELMTGNRQTIDANPVATVRELLARTPAKQEGRATDRKSRRVPDCQAGTSGYRGDDHRSVRHLGNRTHHAAITGSVRQQGQDPFWQAVQTGSHQAHLSAVVACCGIRVGPAHARRPCYAKRQPEAEVRQPTLPRVASVFFFLAPFLVCRLLLIAKKPRCFIASHPIPARTGCQQTTDADEAHHAPFTAVARWAGYRRCPGPPAATHPRR